MFSLIPYLGYGDRTEVIFILRVIRKQYPIKSASRNDNRWQNLLRFLAKYSTKPVNNIPAVFTYNGQTKKFYSDQSGLVEARFLLANLDVSEGLHQATAYSENAESVIVETIVDIDQNEYGIISDIDDTILIANSATKWRLVFEVLFKNGYTRKSFDGVSDFYRRLTRGRSRKCTNPIFYVSSSHWNLYDFLVLFLHENNFPRGPLMLKKVTGWIDLIRNINDHSHKHHKISQLLETYETLNFILIGDSSQADASIYVDIALNYPGRIQHIFIRDVTKGSDKILNTAIKTARNAKCLTKISVAQNTKELQEIAEKELLI